MKYVSAKTISVTSSVTTNGTPLTVLKIEVKTTGSSTPLSMLKFVFSVKGFSKSSGITNAKMYYTGQSDSFATTLPFGILQKPAGKFDISGTQTLVGGTNYFWLMIDSKKELTIDKIPEINLISCTTGLQDYQLVWEDEFNTNGPPNPANWLFEKGFVRNNELQWYNEKNAVCKNGVLTIEARRDTITNPEFNAAGRDWRTRRQYAYYTSSSINTRGVQTWQYGRFELRAKIDTNAGCWPAWWTLGTDGRWPDNGEIDIMEFYKGNILANYAVGTARPYTAKWFSTATPISAFNRTSWADSFHNWRMDWDEAGISIYLDDSLLNHQPQSALYNRSGTNDIYPFRQKHYMLLNLAIGGDNGGDPLHTTFPKKYEIDYVQVLQKIKDKYSLQTIHTVEPLKMKEIKPGLKNKINN